MPASVFNKEYYIFNNSDVALAIELGHFQSGLEHFNLFGSKELRSPNAFFDPLYYLDNNPDLVNALAGALDNIFLHYQLFGEAENDCLPKIRRF